MMQKTSGPPSVVGTEGEARETVRLGGSNSSQIQNFPAPAQAKSVVRWAHIEVSTASELAKPRQWQARFRRRPPFPRYHDRRR